MAKSKRKLDLKDPNVKYGLLAAFVILAAGYAWYDNVYAPMSESIAMHTERKDALESELLKINTLKPQLDRLRKESIMLEAKLDSLKNIFPDRKEVPRLIRDMTTVNRRSNVATTRFTPKPDVEQEYYVENKYDVAVSGDYHDLGSLFSYLANFQLIVNLTSVTITANPNFNIGSGAVAQQAVERQPSVLSTFELTTFSSRR